MIANALQSDEALASVDSSLSYNTRHTGFALNQSKLLKNLQKDADINDYDTVINNFNENINVKCSSGFYVEVASPALLSLAKQTCDTSWLTIKSVRISCFNSRVSIDDHNLLVNNTYFFDLFDDMSGSTLGRVTVHCHVTSKLVQLQGSKMISGIKAPIWFYENVLKETFDRESTERKLTISKTNENILKMAPDDLDCKLCDKKYKTGPGLQKHVQTKHEPIQTSEVAQPLPVRIIRKRRGNNVDIDYCPPTKTLALGGSAPASAPITSSAVPISSTTSPPLTTPSLIDSLHMSAITTAAVLASVSSSSPSVSYSIPMTSSIPTPAPTIHLNLDAAEFIPPFPHSIIQPQHPFPHFSLNIPMSNNQEVSSISTPNVAPTVTVSSSSSTHVPTSAPAFVPTTAMATPPTAPARTSINVTTTTSANPVKSKVKKAKPTLALTPGEFEKENLRVERDACRLEMSKLAIEKKDLSETIEILTTRCRLFEEDRNNVATRNAAPKAVPVSTVGSMKSQHSIKEA